MAAGHPTRSSLDRASSLFCMYICILCPSVLFLSTHIITEKSDRPKVEVESEASSFEERIARPRRTRAIEALSILRKTTSDGKKYPYQESAFLDNEQSAMCHVQVRV